MIRHRWTLVLTLGLLAATAAVAQEAAPPTEAKPADEITVEISGLQNHRTPTSGFDIGAHRLPDGLRASTTSEVAYIISGEDGDPLFDRFASPS